MTFDCNSLPSSNLVGHIAIDNFAGDIKLLLLGLVPEFLTYTSQFVQFLRRFRFLENCSMSIIQDTTATASKPCFHDPFRIDQL